MTQGFETMKNKIDRFDYLEKKQFLHRESST